LKRKRKVRLKKKVQKKLWSKAQKEPLHFALIDPDKTSWRDIYNTAKLLENAGTDAILVGGSTGVTETKLDKLIKELKRNVSIPIILFPGNINGISKYADAILFMSLLNSDDPYFIIGAQMLGAPIILEYGLEPIPTAYIIVGYGGAAGYVGKARPIPFEKPEIGVAYALAAAMLGMKFIYFEAGSGSPKPVPPILIETTRRILGDEVFIIVGGGIRTPEKALELVKAGANAIVTGTILEEDVEKSLEIIKALKRTRVED